MAQAKLKINSTMTSDWVGDELVITMPAIGTILFNRTKASPECRDEAERNGWLQRIADKAALKAPERTVGMADEAWRAALAAHRQAKFDNMERLVEHYETGTDQWRMVVAAGEREGGILVEALVELWKKDRAKIVAFLKTKDAAYRAGLLASDQVKVIADRIRATRVKQVIDTSDALAEFEGFGDDSAE